MPLVSINMINGKSSEYKKTVLECVHASGKNKGTEKKSYRNDYFTVGEQPWSCSYRYFYRNKRATV